MEVCVSESERWANLNRLNIFKIHHKNIYTSYIHVHSTVYFTLMLLNYEKCKFTFKTSTILLLTYFSTDYVKCKLFTLF